MHFISQKATFPFHGHASKFEVEASKDKEKTDFLDWFLFAAVFVFTV
jgi:hypothetical protein